MLFTGTPINAEEALRVGLVSKVIQPCEFGQLIEINKLVKLINLLTFLDDEIIKLTSLIGQKSRDVITLGKRFFYQQIEDNIKSAYK